MASYWKFQFRGLKILKIKKCPKKLNQSVLYVPLNSCHFWCDIAINTRNWRHFDKIKSLLLYKVMEKSQWKVKEKKQWYMPIVAICYNLLIILTISSFQVYLKLSFLTYSLLIYLTFRSTFRSTPKIVQITYILNAKHKRKIHVNMTFQIIFL